MEIPPSESGDGSESFFELVQDLLEVNNVLLPDPVIRELERIIEREAMCRAGVAMHDIVDCLEGSGPGIALKRVLAGPQGKSLREAAEEARCSHVRIWFLERRITERLQKLGQGK